MKDFLEHAVFDVIQLVVEMIASIWDRDRQSQ
jgi:hypothetical protein